jgi:hypothetical protein
MPYRFSPHRGRTSEPGLAAIQINMRIKNLDLERPLTREPPSWHYAVRMQRGRKSISQMARELEPLPNGWSEMSIPDALHLLHLPAAARVSSTGLREALENALEHAKFDEIPVLLGAYRLLESHFGAPEAAATRQDDPTSASWPASVTATAVELDPWEDDPSITVSDIRTIEPASIAQPNSSLQAASAPWFQAASGAGQNNSGQNGSGQNDPRHVVIDDFTLSAQGRLDTRANVRRSIPTVVKMHPADGSRAARAWRLGVPGVLALGIAGLLVLWAYHPFTQGLMAGLLGQTPQASQATLSAPTQATQPEAGMAEPLESAPTAISSEPVMVRAPEPSTPNAMAPASEKPVSSQSISGQSISGQSISGQLISSRATPKKPVLNDQTLKSNSSKISTNTVGPSKINPAKTVSSKSDSTVKKVTANVVTRKATSVVKPKSIGNTARQSKPTQARTAQARVRKPQAALVSAQTAKKAIQVVASAVTQAPRATAGKPLGVSSQPDRTAGTMPARTNPNSVTRPKVSSAKPVNPKPANPKVASPKMAITKPTPKPDSSITNPIKNVSSDGLDAIANPQPVASIKTPKTSGRIDNLSREEFGQRYFNRKLYEVWQRDGAKLLYGSWDAVPLELQILENDLFRSAIYIDGPSGNDAKDNEKPAQP